MTMVAAVDIEKEQIVGVTVIPGVVIGFIAPVTDRTTEYRAGVRKIWDNATIVSPYLDGGVALVEAEMDGSVPGVVSFADADSSVGWWLGGGFY